MSHTTTNNRNIKDKLFIIHMIAPAEETRAIITQTQKTRNFIYKLKKAALACVYMTARHSLDE